MTSYEPLTRRVAEQVGLVLWNDEDAFRRVRAHVLDTLLGWDPPDFHGDRVEKPLAVADYFESTPEDFAVRALCAEATRLAVYAVIFRHPDPRRDGAPLEHRILGELFHASLDLWYLLSEDVVPDPVELRLAAERMVREVAP